MYASWLIDVYAPSPQRESWEYEPNTPSAALANGNAESSGLFVLVWKQVRNRAEPGRIAVGDRIHGIARDAPVRIAADNRAAFLVVRIPSHRGLDERRVVHRVVDDTRPGEDAEIVLRAVVPALDDA